jgi:SAM-dependent methyltransferase/tetratricopeptide (TPR) repeat protein
MAVAGAGPVDPVMRAAMFRRLCRRLAANGQITLPAVPGMVDAYVAMCGQIFGALGSEFVDDQFEGLRAALANQLTNAFTASPRSSIAVSFDSPAGTLLSYRITPQWQTIEASYSAWAAGGDPIPFGDHPDARVCALADELTDPPTARVLDIGAGTGRNALALARRGHPVDAVELTPAFADLIRSGARREALDIRVISADVFAGIERLRRDYQMVVLSGVVSDFRSTEQLRAVFELAARCLAPDGYLVANAFVPRGDYVPDDTARGLSQQLYSSIFTREELDAAVDGLPLELVGDDSVHDYEKTHLPAGAWPPTHWYADWATGGEVFDLEVEQRPIEARWLVYRRAPGDPATELLAPTGDTHTGIPAICLNMIVRNEAHIIHELLDTVAPFITSWVIVDTGSTDGTQDVIRARMADLGIPGELHERPWRNFGHNRSEALALAQGHGDYIWVIDADDLVVGIPDFSRLTADGCSLRYGDATGFNYWRRQLFRDGMPWGYQGVVHEYSTCDVSHVDQRLEGDYHIESRRLGGRNQDSQKYARDAELLLAEVQRNPSDGRSVFYLAQSYYDLGDFARARDWYGRRSQMGGWDEEIYVAMLRYADSMSELGEPWPDVQDAYLRAWEFRPIRAEALFTIAYHCRTNKRYQLGYMFAKQAAAIPLPQNDILFVGGDVHAWRALDEQAVCASWIGKYDEAVALFGYLLAGTDLPAEHRARVAAGRDHCVRMSSFRAGQ